MAPARLLDHFSGSDVSVTAVLSGVLKISSRFLDAMIIMVISAADLAGSHATTATA